MNISPMNKALALMVVIGVCSCNENDPLASFRSQTLRGKVDCSGAEDRRGPVFVLVTNTDDIDRIENFSVESVLTVTAVGPDNTFEIPFSDLQAAPEKPVYLFAFIDNDYAGGIPQPTPGDWVGFYFDKERWKTAYVLGEYNHEVVIRINRKVYDYTARVTGTMLDNEAGDYILIAYAGEITSMDPALFDVDNVIGYQRLTKPDGPYDYSLRILPYGRNIPITDVYVIALVDRNKNGIPDAGDRIGLYSGNSNNIPETMRVESGTHDGFDIRMTLQIMKPSGLAVRVTGTFTAPAGYDVDSQSVSILIAKTDDPSLLFTHPLDAIKGFQKLQPGATTFDIDLSYSDLVPGDSIMILALWDLDSTGGFPKPTPGDRIGYFQNTTVDAFAFNATLSEGTTTIAPQGTWTFRVNKILYDYDTSVRFTIDPANRPSDLDESHDLIAVAMFKDGVNDGGALPDYRINDIDYAIGFSRFSYRADSAVEYSLAIFPALDERITPTETMSVYVYVLYDRDGDGKPSSGDDVAAYWRTRWYFIVPVKVPTIWDLASNTVNVLTAPDDDVANPYAVQFLGQTY